MSRASTLARAIGADGALNVADVAGQPLSRPAVLLPI